jgi:formamidopyrimidine-DNA glycosylase
LAAFQFHNGTLSLTEAGSQRRASLHLVAGEAGLQQLDPGGLEVLAADVDAFAKVLTSANHTLKRALTDPRLFSGVGNAYSDEILFHARLSPIALTQKLSTEQIERLYTATRATLNDWVARLRAQVTRNDSDNSTELCDDATQTGDDVMQAVSLRPRGRKSTAAKRGSSSGARITEPGSRPTRGPLPGSPDGVGAVREDSLSKVPATTFQAPQPIAFPEKVTAFREDMAVHGRYKQPCLVCGAKIQRIRYASNETNYCPNCQTAGKLLADRSLSRLLRADWPRTLEELEGLTRKK